MEPVLLSLLIAVDVLYGTACALLGSRPDAPLWLRWPHPVWKFIRFGPSPRPRPDYARIALLERQLGLADDAPEAPSRSLRPSMVVPAAEDLPEVLARSRAQLRLGQPDIHQGGRPMMHDAVCLTKDCAGDMGEIRTWSGVLLRRIHHCEAP